jgi:hypothetical protein
LGLDCKWLGFIFLNLTKKNYIAKELGFFWFSNVNKNSTNFVNFFLENFAKIFNRIRQGCIITIIPKKEKNKNLRLFTFNWGAKNQKQKKPK